jgi:hypothetical protein
MTFAIDEFEIKFIEIQTTTIVMDSYNRCNGINHLCTNFIQKSQE